MNVFGRKVNLLALFVIAVAVCVLFLFYYKQSGWLDASVNSTPTPRVLPEKVDLKQPGGSTAKKTKNNTRRETDRVTHSQTSNVRKDNGHTKRPDLKLNTKVQVNPEVVDVKPVRQHGYIITQTYNGQMTRAIRNMMGQQCWAWSLGKERGSVSVVEPFSSESKLVHFRRFWDAFEHDQLHEAVRFSEYFDIAHYNKLSVKSKNSPIALWESFLSDSQAPRYFVVVVLPSGRCTLPQSRPVNASTVKEISTSCFYSKPLSELIQGLMQRFNGSIVKKVCIDCSMLKHRLTVDELRDIIYGNGDSSQYTVVMNTWRNFAYTQNWLEVPSYCKAEESPQSSDRLVPGKSVATHSKIYKEKMIKSDRIIAMMFRIERFLTLKVLGRSNETLSSCIQKVLDIRNQLLRDKSMATFLTLDIGRFGSKLMQKNTTVAKYGQNSLDSINKTMHDALGSIYNGQFNSIKEWEDSFIEAADGITERGYISLIQRSIATEADCLILMGGGSYQQVAVQQYIMNHPEPSTQCIHTVCVHDSFQRLLPEG